MIQKKNMSSRRMRDCEVFRPHLWSSNYIMNTNYMIYKGINGMQLNLFRVSHLDLHIRNAVSFCLLTLCHFCLTVINTIENEQILFFVTMLCLLDKNEVQICSFQKKGLWFDTKIISLRPIEVFLQIWPDSRCSSDATLILSSGVSYHNNIKTFLIFSYS